VAAVRLAPKPDPGPLPRGLRQLKVVGVADAEAVQPWDHPGPGPGPLGRSEDVVRGGGGGSAGHELGGGRVLKT